VSASTAAAVEARPAAGAARPTGQERLPAGHTRPGPPTRPSRPRSPGVTPLTPDPTEETVPAPLWRHPCPAAAWRLGSWSRWH